MIGRGQQALHLVPVARKDVRSRAGKEDFVLINVLPEEDFKKEHIRTSINIPQDSEDFVETVEKVAGGKDGEVVVYCASFDCPASPEAAKKLDEAGFLFQCGLQHPGVH